MTCIILVSGNNVISYTTAVRCRKSHEGVPFNMVHFKHRSYLNILVTRWQKENMSTPQKFQYMCSCIPLCLAPWWLF